MQDETLTENLSLIDEETPLPEGWRLVRLGDICYQSKMIIEPSSEKAKKLPYLGLESVESGTGKILPSTNGVSSEEGKSTTFYFNSKHILYGKLRPYLNKVALPDFEGRCTTEMIPLLPTEDTAREYLLLILRRQETVNAVMRETTGSRMPRADTTTLLNLKIPLPPTIEEQRRIASVLDEQMKAVEQARFAVEAQLKAANLLPNAFLRVVFESEEAQNWQKRKLGEVCNVQLGKMLSPKSKGGLTPRPYLRNANVQWSRLNLGNIATMDFSDQEAKKFELKHGDLLVCEGGEPGRAAIWREEIKPCYYQKALHRLRPLNGSINPEFLMYRLWFSANQGEFVDSNAKTTIAHLPAIRLLELPIEHPTIEEQTKIVERINKQMQSAETLKKSLTEKLEAVKKLPAALLRKAFAGRI